MSEEDANNAFGQDHVEVYHSTFKPLEWTISIDYSTCYCKLVVHSTGGNRVVGIHILSPHAGEVIQGCAIAMKVFLPPSHTTSIIF
jgi:pyruvate/2-oxoglutarate dehydrogenase complex dihydrolipoamide dehydrogenase (E3) component